MQTTAGTEHFWSLLAIGWERNTVGSQTDQLVVHFPHCQRQLEFHTSLTGFPKDYVPSCFGAMLLREDRYPFESFIVVPSPSVFAVCPLPPEPENGGYICHPRPCKDPLTSGSVIEYLCAEGYMLKGDYKYLTCKNGEWKPAMEVSCHLNEGQSASKKGCCLGPAFP